MLDSITPGTVSVWACGGSMVCAHWGHFLGQREFIGGVWIHMRAPTTRELGESTVAA